MDEPESARWFEVIDDRGSDGPPFSEFQATVLRRLRRQYPIWLSLGLAPLDTGAYGCDRRMWITLALPEWGDPSRSCLRADFDDSCWKVAWIAPYDSLWDHPQLDVVAISEVIHGDFVDPVHGVDAMLDQLLAHLGRPRLRRHDRHRRHSRPPT